MARWLPALLTSALALSVASAAPALKHKAPASFHPTTLGARWVYLDDGAEYTFVVAKVEETDGAFVVDVAAVKGGREEPCQRMRASAAGVFRLSIGSTTYPAPECLLKLPHRDGQEWEFDLGPSGGGHSNLTAVRRERVETPAGTFDCIRVERTGGYPATYWFAEGVGMVRVKTDERDRVLKSFTPGKKRAAGGPTTTNCRPEVGGLRRPGGRPGRGGLGRHQPAPDGPPVRPPGRRGRTNRARGSGPAMAAPGLTPAPRPGRAESPFLRVKYRLGRARLG